MRAAFDARVHYVDMGGLFHVTRKQLALDAEAKAVGVVAVLGAGESPGMSNLMCQASAEGMDMVETVKIRVGGRDVTSSNSGKLVFPFAVSTVFDEYSKTPVMYFDGEYREVAPLSGAEEVQFPEPVGKQTCHYSIHSELATLPHNLGPVRSVDFKLGVSDRIYRAIKPFLDAGMANEEPVNVRGQMVSPRDLAISILTARASDVEPTRFVGVRTEVVGSRRRQRLRQIRDLLGAPSEKIGVRNATSLLTGIGASITAQLIVAGEIKESGVMGPESCVPTSSFMSELGKRGINVAIDTRPEPMRTA